MKLYVVPNTYLLSPKFVSLNILEREVRYLKVSRKTEIPFYTGVNLHSGMDKAPGDHVSDFLQLWFSLTIKSHNF